MTSPESTSESSGPVVVVDDHPLVRRAIVAALIQGGLPALECSVPNPDAAAAWIATLRPGSVVLDIDLGRGFEDAGRLITPILVAAGWRVIILTGNRDRETLGACLAAGAAGWVGKDHPLDEIVALIRRAVAGDEIVSYDERVRALALFREGAAGASRLALLSPREREVLDKIFEGLSAQEIAAEFIVSVHTVRTQIKSVLRKLQVPSQLSAVALVRHLQH
ncbi:response regulator transcription factor [Agromyces neolithicus]|uniref:Response regulator n=1 Tax=Agromyces neolithicus TaxID=269420 RepID=A0ABN2M8R3_9MICO